MLVLSRTAGKSLTILTPQGPVVVTVLRTDGRRVWLGFDAARNILIERPDRAGGQGRLPPETPPLPNGGGSP